MLTASARLLSLLSLLQSRPHWSGSALAERMDIHPRTLRRDIDRLRQLGYPIHASTGVAGGYAFARGAPCHPCCWTTRKRWQQRSRCGRP